jgi:hypothetical protein
MDLVDLAGQWLAAKTDEARANATRLEIEELLLKQMPAKEEGRLSHTLTNGWKFSSTGKISYKADIPKLQLLTLSWPADTRPIKTKIEADEVILRQIRSERADLWRSIAPAITTKPAKTYVQIEVPDGV